MTTGQWTGRSPDDFAEEILELTYIICLYDMHATMCRALHLEYDEVEERIVEIAAPSDHPQEVNFMAPVDNN